MINIIQRKSNNQAVSLTASSATTDEIPYGDFDSGGIVVTALTTGATINFYGAEKTGGTYAPIYDSSNAIKAQGIAATRAYALPAECRGFPFIKLVLDAGSATGNIVRKS